MKKALVCLTITLSAAAAPMSRVIGVRDSHTIIVETNGVQSEVTLNGVAIAPEEEARAVEYVRRIANNTWVLVENGDVYRSPDGLYINGEIARHAWRTTPGLTFLGELDLGARAKGQPVGNSVTAPTLPPPAQRVTPARRGTNASRSRSRRSGRAR